MICSRTLEMQHFTYYFHFCIIQFFEMIVYFLPMYVVKNDFAHTVGICWYVCGKNDFAHTVDLRLS